MFISRWISQLSGYRPLDISHWLTGTGYHPLDNRHWISSIGMTYKKQKCRILKMTGQRNQMTDNSSANTENRNENTIELKNLTPSQFQDLFRECSARPYAWKQAMKWIYQRDMSDPEQWTDLSKELRQKLRDISTTLVMEPDLIMQSTTGTVKFRFSLEDDSAIESVLIPDGKRLTACISTQVGCKMGCTFCATGKLGFSRNLEPSEIIEQIMSMNRWLNNNPMKRVIHENIKNDINIEKLRGTFYEKITHIVVMGMGEPFDNVKNLASAISILQNDLALQFASRRITVSTCGHVKGMTEFGKLAESLDIRVLLALSMGSPFDEERSDCMPVNKKWNLDALVDAVRAFPHPPRERVTLEYTLIKDLNDTAAHAKALAKFAHRCNGKVNLIPLNEHKNSELKAPDKRAVEEFQQLLLNKKILATIRKSLGQDIEAACGMLGRSSNAKQQ
jgi:23S rRNA (adenine2503-C2)-methyltransferase